MLKKSEIYLLKEKINELKNKDTTPEVWRDLTIDIVRKIFPQSANDKINAIKKINFNANAPLSPPEINNKKYERAIDQAVELLNGYINEIKKLGREGKKRRKDNAIIVLFKNIYFWPTLGFFIALSLNIGYNFGINKFDKEKTDYYYENINLKSDNSKLNKDIFIKDSIIKMKNDSIVFLKK